jgi:hypothetical protein
MSKNEKSSPKLTWNYHVNFFRGKVYMPVEDVIQGLGIFGLSSIASDLNFKLHKKWQGQAEGLTKKGEKTKPRNDHRSLIDQQISDALNEAARQELEDEGDI